MIRAGKADGKTMGFAIIDEKTRKIVNFVADNGKVDAYKLAEEADELWKKLPMETRKLIKQDVCKVEFIENK